MTCSLIITTYNWPEALDLTLKSVLDQKVLPNEIIIADDGSDEKTLVMVQKWQSIFTIPLIHSWQEDNGFQLSKSRNKAIAKAKSDYIIMIDGDILLHPNFIKEHLKHSKENQFVIGTRVLLTEKYSKELISKQKKISFSLNKKETIRNYKNLFNNSILSKLFSYKTNSYKSVRGCNMAWFRNDLIKVNGFNEDFEGWGREDTELVIRLLNNNIIRKNVKFNVNTLHIYHIENSKNKLNENDILLKNTIDAKLKSCKNGLDKYLI